MPLTLELPPDVESRLHELSARTGQKPEDYLIGLVREAAETEKTADDLDAAWDDYHARFGQETGPTAEELKATFRQNAEDFAASRWLTLEELDAAMRASGDRLKEKAEFDAAVAGIRRGMADAAAGREITIEDYWAEIARERGTARQQAA